MKYPKKLPEFDLLEYFENDQRIGLLLASNAKPDNTLFNDSSRFCTNEGVNAGNLGYWVALQSIHALPKRIVLTAARKFYPPSELLKQEYHLVKLFPNLYAQYPQPGVLDSLFTAGADASIVRLDAARPRAVVPVRADLVTPGFSVFAICFEWIEDGYWYDEAKRLVPHKSIGGRIVFIPVFPAKPK